MQKSLKRKRDENDELRPGGLYLDTVIYFYILYIYIYDIFYKCNKDI